MVLRGVRFGEHHTAEDWGLIMNEKIVSPPVPKTNYITVLGRDGDLDMTEDLSGVVNYQDRTAQYTFILADGSHEDREALIAQIMGLLHGRKLEIVDEDDYPGYYMVGRLSVTEVTNSNAYGIIRIEAICQPWRYSQTYKTREATVTAGGASVTLNLINAGYKTVSPTLTVSGTVTVTYRSVAKTLSSGSYILPDIRFTPGANSLVVSGSGTLTVTYQEAIF